MHQLFSINHEPGGSGGALREITRALRQFCLFHEMGSGQKAIEQQGQRLDEMITAYRAAHGEESLSDERLRVLLLDEQERIATAAALSETLAPLLAERLQLASAGRPRARQPKPGPNGSAGPAQKPPGVQSVAEMIDSMLAQDEAAVPVLRRSRR